ncbi:MAG TPA: Clp protease N-terminal domain-containing protein [Solirubrobacteraceae bacterium]|nr:Clp protease N-terminal domain-containing protein [Solirubrobacteraceae bacterium]
MTRGKQTTALALAGAVALASGAYALGTQVDDGNAAAAKTPNAAPAFAGGPGRPGFGHGFRGGPGGPLLEGAADRLGVSEAKLRTALEEIAKEHRSDFAQKLADALNIDRAKVEAVFDKVRPTRPDRPRAPEAFAAALAKELGITTAKVRAALEKHRNNPTSPDDLAKELGVSEQKLHDAFHAVMGKIRPRGGPDHRPGLDNLTKQLGVTQAQLEAAFDKLRADHEKIEDQFAQELADKLGIDVQKVEDAIDDFRPFGRHHP